MDIFEEIKQAEEEQRQIENKLAQLKVIEEQLLSSTDPDAVIAYLKSVGFDEYDHNWFYDSDYEERFSICYICYIPASGIMKYADIEYNPIQDSVLEFKVDSVVSAKAALVALSTPEYVKETRSIGFTVPLISKNPYEQLQSAILLIKEILENEDADELATRISISHNSEV